MNLLLPKILARDVLKMNSARNLRPLDVHIQAAFDWLCMAQDVNPDGGVSLRYSLVKGWDFSYPETTGYIIPNFIKHAGRTNNKEYIDRALRMADWELSIQQKDGSFRGGPLGSGHDGFVFDTGQVIFGLIAAHKATRQEKYIEGALKAAQWLVDVQNDEGMWSKHTFHSIPHTYYTRVAWALAELGVFTEKEIFSRSACRNIEWAMTKQQKNGWFDHTGFTEKGHCTPYTHTIAYTIEGIIETGACLGREDYLKAAALSADSLCQVINKNGFCHGTYDRNWDSNDRYSCLTGTAQIALTLLRLYEIYGNKKYIETALSLNLFLRKRQETAELSAVRGAISGSYPIWGNYQKFAFPNWAAKFFIDALLLEEKLTGAVEGLK